MAKVRVSVGNLVTQIRNSETGKIYFVGLLNRKALTQGRRLYAAIGGAAEVTPAGKERLEQRYGAEFQEGMDARFLLDEERLEHV